MLMITHDSKRKKYATGVAATAEEWNYGLCLLTGTARNFKKNNKTLTDTLGKAENIIDEFARERRPFSFTAFDLQFSGIEPQDVFEYFGETIERLKATGHLGNARAYLSCRGPW